MPEKGSAVIIDPVAVSQEAARELCKVEWPGIALMADDFQMSLLDDGADVAGMAEAWFDANKAAVADEIRRRTVDYRVERLSASAATAMAEACFAYAQGSYLAVVRVLMPEFEAVARTLVGKRSQKAAVDGLLRLIQDVPMIREDPIEAMSMVEFIDDQLFASCKDAAHAAARGQAPNRHAETHALKSYGNLRGASYMMCGTDLLLRLAARHLDLAQQFPPEAT
ncbi:hypothetical protein ASE95_08565 [Sphingomonas sp. Leaf231]|uniref:hypothetical protein n=1 Tax=Sphingomonas sp. Leaf231 TaxID=1736301 RepID=UPI0006FE996E|nr:hypothetical protein [Sphingomonas sp. Leaf231]KQN92710.1 hypothetical protein ASE95_08565 [Sphingomonas sp. Leaf231]